MIPKKVHYCWLSGEKMPDMMAHCVESWHRSLNGYEFILWDMQRAGAIDSAWLKNAINNRQWAFATDYVRLWALYKEGGIYLDADVEVVRDFAPLLDCELLLGEEGGSGLIEAAVIGAVADNRLIKRVLDSFDDQITSETLPQRLSRVIGGDVTLLPSCTFSPKDWKTGRLCVTDRTYAIHHFAGTWLCAKERWAQKMGRLLGKWAIPCTRWICCRFVDET